MMKGKHEYNKQINLFFGSKNEYKIFAVKSDLSLIPFAAKFEKKIDSQFSFLTTIETIQNGYNAQFSVMYSLVSEEDNLHCSIIENKTTQFSSENLKSSSVEKNLPFQSLSLFNDTLYILNNEGLKIFKSQFSYYDYLIFIHVDKERNIDSLIQKISALKEYKLIEITSLIEKPENNKKALVEVFLKNIFCTLEVFINKFHQNKIQSYLGSCIKIPESNLVNPLKLEIESEITEKMTFNVNPEYVKILTHEVDSL